MAYTDLRYFVVQYKCYKKIRKNLRKLYKTIAFKERSFYNTSKVSIERMFYKRIFTKEYGGFLSCMEISHLYFATDVL